VLNVIDQVIPCEVTLIQVFDINTRNFVVVRGRGGEAKRAVLTLERVCQDDPGEPGYRMLLAGMHARAGDDARALATYAELADDDGTRYSAPLRARALWRAADLHAHRGELADATRLVERALALSVDEDTRRNLVIRRLAFAAPPEDAGARALRDYLVPPTPDADANDEAEPPTPERDPTLVRAALLPKAIGALGHYLYGRVLVQRGRYADAARELAGAAAGGLDEPLVRRENDRLLLEAAFLAGDLVTAHATATRLDATSEPLQVRLEAEDWLERIAFSAARRK